MKVAAFFDFDKTLVAKDSQGLEGIHVLLKNHWHRSPFVTLGLLGAWVSDQLEEYGLVPMGMSAKIYVMAYRGINISELIKSAPELYSAQIRPRLYPDMLRLMDEHRNQGHLIIFLSATSEHIIQPFADEVDNDGFFSTQIECDSNGICSGFPKVLLHGGEKARVVEELAESHNIDLQQSFAYSDHHGDIPLLEKVGNPVAVNPTKKLQDCARKLGWRKLTTQPIGCGQRKQPKNYAQGVVWLTLLLISMLFYMFLSPEAHNMDLRHSWADSDHHGDIPLLEKVGNPVAVNPTKKLEDCAREFGWRNLTTQPISRDHQPENFTDISSIGFVFGPIITC